MSIMPAFRIVNDWLGDPARFPELREFFATDPADLGEGLRGLVGFAFENGWIDEAARDQATAALDGVSGVLAGFPKSHQAALFAVVRSALERDVPVPVLMAWQPSYDHELTVTEFQDTADEVCGVTVLLKSRHASDPRMGAVSG